MILPSPPPSPPVDLLPMLRLGQWVLRDFYQYAGVVNLSLASLYLLDWTAW